MKKKKRYLVTYHLVGEQTTIIEATSKKEIRELMKNHIGDPVDFNVLHACWSTAVITELKDDSAV